MWQLLPTRKRTHRLRLWVLHLSQLASIIECDAEGKISILHASLSDFLLDPSRSHQFYLCRESVLGNSAVLGLRHLRQQEHDGDGVPILPSWQSILRVLICNIFYSRFWALPVGHRGLHWSWPMLHPSTSRGAQSTIIPDSPQPQ